jgi:CDP-diacylglycerol--glycerol-3-phosphate 3-phosphatidyltransferase
MVTLPNLLTFVRIATIPFLVLAFYLPASWGHAAASLIFALASLTDWLDGYLARSLKQSSKLGAFLDPVADKLMVSVALVLIVGEPQFQFVSLPSAVYSVPIPLITIPAAIIVSREIVVSALREWMAEMGKRTSIAVSQLGKIKTTVQMIALVILLYCSPKSNAFIAITGYVFLYVAAVLTLWSMGLYLKAAWFELRDNSPLDTRKT